MCKNSEISGKILKNSGGPLDNQTWQTEWKTAPLAAVQLRVSTNTKLWKLLLWRAVCMPSLIVQWPTRTFHLATAHDSETAY